LHVFDELFDSLFSRFGVMFFEDLAAGFGNLHRALRPRGRLVFVCWRTFEENEWLAVPASVVSGTRPATPLATLAAPGPGPSAPARKGDIEAFLSAGGFVDIDIEPYDAAVRVSTTGVDDAAEFAASSGPVARWFAVATPAERTAALSALRQALAPR